jgi:5-methylcytosine-specific restriction endonuclease McrBC regulatory subunit McrC
VFAAHSPDLRVEHGTAAREDAFPMRAEDEAGRGLGRLKPVVLIWARDGLLAVVDAKYKHLRDYWPERPHGVERADLKQLASYLSRYDPRAVLDARLPPRP